MTNEKFARHGNTLVDLILEHVDYKEANKDVFVPFNAWEDDFEPSTEEIDRVASLLEREGILVNTTPTNRMVKGKNVRGVYMRIDPTVKCYELETVETHGDMFLACSHCGEIVCFVSEYDSLKRAGQSVCEHCGVNLNLRCETIERKRKLILPAMEEFLDLTRNDKCMQLLSSNARLLWYVLAVVCHEHGAENPVRVNQSVLEEMCGLSKYQLDAATEELINACMIYTNKQRNGYYILILGGRE